MVNIYIAYVLGHMDNQFLTYFMKFMGLEKSLDQLISTNKSITDYSCNLKVLLRNFSPVYSQ